jgi:hypothetical protein
LQGFELCTVFGIENLPDAQVFPSGRVFGIVDVPDDAPPQGNGIDRLWP